MSFLSFIAKTKYIAGHFSCSSCDHETVIFIDENYSLMSIMDVNEVCSICKTQKEVVTAGDLILRYDYQDADNYPWQLQCASLRTEQKYCKDCYKSDSENDWKELIVACTQCEGDMTAK